MRIVLLTQYYPPEIGAPQNRLSGLAIRFAQRGHDVTVLTAMPNYPKGEIYPGYGGLWRKEMHGDVRIIRTFIYPTQKADYFHRLANYFSFVVSSAVFGSFLLRRVDYLLVESPPLFLGMSGFWLSRLKGARLIFNVSDLWPESATRLGVLRPTGLAYRLSAWLEQFCYRRSWVISGQSKGILLSITNRFPSSSTYHLSNGVDTSRFGPQEWEQATHDRMSRNGEVIALYAGLHGLAQGLDQVLDAAERLQDSHRVRFVLIGDGPEKGTLMQRARKERLTSVSFLDPVASAEMPVLIASADIVLVILKVYIPGAVPSKLYEAMASGRPIVLVAEGEAAQIVLDSKAGLVVKPGDVDGLVAAIRTLQENSLMCAEFGQNGRKAVEHNYDRTKIADEFIDYLEARTQQ
jgi:glycosyltransferase involved in cell wall biosynthesis